ncbi:hypothetical protein B0T16DRAFT_452258 [Cercophora newfieldiana]|uniref:2EXR domain-containing protein n=1 Tax=Cercophora newfieldiana TaxID=92897 RepID=A0AA40CZ33_9PEZI|nr:hypothetical protein B0T16DRAFT_452258 [Cercophora newfieldiana]
MNYEQPFHRCCPVQTPDRFGLFQRLPAEIRNMIWEYSLPESRVYEVLDAPNAKQKTKAEKGLMFANVHPEPPPALAAVCRESRYFVLHAYKPLTLGSTTKYVDLSRDILLLEPYLLVKRLHRTLHFMSQISLVRDNINRLALGTSYGVYTGICHPVLSWKVSKNNMGKLLQTLAKFPKLKLLIFVVHQEFQFEFDFRFPGTLTPIPNQPPPAGYLSSAAPPPSFGHGATSYPSPVSSHNGSRIGATLSPLPSSPTAAYPSSPGYPSPITPRPGPGPAHLPSGFPSPPPHHQYQHHHQAQQQQQTQTQTQTALPRPQLVHQAYRFKFDIEANINHTPRRPHLNELLYYPLDIDEDKEDWDLGDLGTEESEWCDPWPTNDDWRRFRKRFQRAINLSLEMGLVGEEGEKRPWCRERERGEYAAGAGGGHGRGERAEGVRRMQIPALKGASLLWRYTRGGYV